MEIVAKPREWMVDRGRPGVKRRESVHVEGYRIESKDSLVTLQCTGSGT